MGGEGREKTKEILLAVNVILMTWKRTFSWGVRNMFHPE